MYSDIFLLLGTNLGDRMINITVAKSHIQAEIGEIQKASSIYRSAPWGKPDQPEFYNQVIMVDTSLKPDSLLNALLSIEARMGRIRHEKWGSRIIDIDLLFYQNQVIRQNNLKVPHPGIVDRRFTLEPLFEIAPDMIHPVLEKSIRVLLQDCNDKLPVKIILDK